MTLKLKKKSSFTLLEIFVCVAILAVAAVTVGWQMRNMVASHHFHQNVANLLTDLKKCQIIALADRIDIEMRIQKKGDRFEYVLYTDEPNVGFSKRGMKMVGVKEICQDSERVTELTIPIFSSGTIEQKQKVRLYQDENNGVELDFSQPHLIRQKRIQS